MTTKAPPPRPNVAGTGGGDLYIVRQRSSFTHAHLFAAAFQRDEARKLEADRSDGDLWAERHRAAVVGSVISSFAFVEANINQLYADAKDGAPSTTARSLGSTKARLLVAAWETNPTTWFGKTRTAKYHSTSAKYQAALSETGAAIFTNGAAPFLGMDLVRQTRNALVHAETLTVVAYSKDPSTPVSRTSWQAQLEAEANSGGFSLAAHRDETHAFFPDRLLSASFSDWCLRRCVEFSDDFYSRLGTASPYGDATKLISP